MALPWTLSLKSRSTTLVTSSTGGASRGGKRVRRNHQLPSIPKQEEFERAKKGSGTMKVFTVSDLHTDYAANMEWVKGLSSSLYQPDTLIVAGDVADTLHTFTITMSILKEKFQHVFFVPGNHDLWCKSPEDSHLDSVSKLRVLNDVCTSIGVTTTATKLNGVWIVPLLSWYHQSFDKEKDIEGFNIRPPEKAWEFGMLVRGPLCQILKTKSGGMGSGSFRFSFMQMATTSQQLVDEDLARYCDELNSKEFPSVFSAEQDKCQVITFSHFLPRLELCPEKRMLFYPNLPKVVGSDWLEARVRSIHGPHGSETACHVFGHTHFCWDATLDGIRYIQAPLAYPKERERRMNGGEEWLPLCIYDSEKGGLIGGPLQCYWSEYYSSHSREPENTELAPWVADLYHPVSAS